MNRIILMLPLMLFLCSCATSRDMTSSYYLPEWENKLVTFPSPTETSGGRWAALGARKLSSGIQQTLFLPCALVGNLALNAYYIPTWPIRATFRGDKRLLVWHPLLGVGQRVESDFFSSEWNRDLV